MIGQFVVGKANTIKRCHLQQLHLYFRLVVLVIVYDD
jgi:hypothetical protein